MWQVSTEQLKRSSAGEDEEAQPMLVLAGEWLCVEMERLSPACVVKKEGAAR